MNIRQKYGRDDEIFHNDERVNYSRSYKIDGAKID